MHDCFPLLGAEGVITPSQHISIPILIAINKLPFKVLINILPSEHFMLIPPSLANAGCLQSFTFFVDNDLWKPELCFIYIRQMTEGKNLLIGLLPNYIFNCLFIPPYIFFCCRLSDL